MAIPVPRICWPYIVTSSNNAFDLRFSDNNAPAYNQIGNTMSGTIATGTYTTPEALATACQTAINSALTAAIPSFPTGTGSYSFQIVVGPTGIFNLEWTIPSGTNIAIIWINAMNSSSAPLLAWQAMLGFGAQASALFNGGTFADLAGAQAQNLWIASNPVISDSRPIFTYARDTSITFDSAKVVDWGAIERREVQLNYEPAQKVFIGSEYNPVSNDWTYPNQAIERFFAANTGGVGFFTYSPDAANPTKDSYTDDRAVHTYALDPETAQQFKPERWAPGVPQFKLLLKMIRTF